MDEPVAWYYAGSDIEGHSVALDADLDDAQKANCIPLYTTPPQREWQGLTDEQVKQIEMSASSTLSAIYLAEAQLKGKNT